MAYSTGMEQIATQMGINFYLFVMVVAWTIFWKLFGMWKSARNGHIFWFIIIALINTVGIIPIIYIFGIPEFLRRKGDHKNNGKPRTPTKDSYANKKTRG